MKDVSIENLKIFVSKNQSYYIPIFQKISSLGGRFYASWNWAAFFFPQMWFFYRKMYLYGVIVLLASCVFNLIGWILSGIIAGVAGNYLYFSHARNGILSLQETFPGETISSKVALLGGTNSIIAWAAVIITVVLLMIPVLFIPFYRP